jgi:hypothetical protein
MARQPSPANPGARTVGARSARRTGEKSSSTDLGMDASGKFGNGGQWTLGMQAAFDAQARALGIEVPDQGAFTAQMFRNMAENTSSELPKPTNTGTSKKKNNLLLDSLMAYAKTLLSSADAGNATVNSQYDAVLAELLAQKGTADTAVNTGTTSAVDALKALVNPYANLQLASTQNATNPLAAYQAALGYGPDNQTNALADLLTLQNQQANNANYNTGQLASSGWNTINQAQQTQASARGADAIIANENARRLAALGAMGTRDAALNANATTRQTGLDTLMTQLLTLAANGQDVSAIIKLLGGGK